MAFVKEKEAVLILEDGEVFRGRATGSEGTVVGEVCFNTAMSGYQEVLTDPSYRGQLVAMTFPQRCCCAVSAKPRWRRIVRRWRNGRCSPVHFWRAACTFEQL